jgi:hypothetical protein
MLSRIHNNNLTCIIKHEKQCKIKTDENTNVNLRDHLHFKGSSNNVDCATKLEYFKFEN